jgi:hypothetical protein
VCTSSQPMNPTHKKFHLPNGARQGKTGSLRLKCDGTRAETRFRLSAKRTSPFKSPGGGVSSVEYCAAEVCASAVMLDTSCSEVVWRVLVTHCIRQFPLHFLSRAPPCAITFRLESKKGERVQYWNLKKEEQGATLWRNNFEEARDQSRSCRKTNYIVYEMSP